jgi:hypothetical protein
VITSPAKPPEDLSFPACGENTTAASSAADRSIRPAENLSPNPASVALASEPTPDVLDALEAGDGDIQAVDDPDDP